ncbi:hypothetical protein MRX96_027980 [Rhipicephalus microplus]
MTARTSLTTLTPRLRKMPFAMDEARGASFPATDDMRRFSSCCSHHCSALAFLGNHPFLDYYQSAPVTIQSLAWNASSQETPRMPFLSAARFCVWQHRPTTSEGRQHRLQSDRLAQLRRSVGRFLEDGVPDNSLELSMVVFNQKARVVEPPTMLNATVRRRLKETALPVSVGGRTSMGAGIVAAVEVGMDTSNIARKR